MENQNKFEMIFPNMHESLILFAKVIAVLKSDNAQDASEICMYNQIEIWEEYGDGYKLTVYVDPYSTDDELQMYIDLKVYFYNEKEYNGF